MSGIFGAFYRDGEVPSGALTGRTACLAARGADAREVVVLGPVALAVCRYDWELEDDFAGPVMVVDEGDLVVAADASLYYRRGLERALASRGVCPTGKAPSHLVLAAYRAWGDQFAARLDGDFAFVLFDRREQRLLAARDFAGSRPLYYADLGHAVLVGSTMGAIIAYPGCPDELNLTSIAETAAGLFTVPGETCYARVSSLGAGHTLFATRRGLHTAPHWAPPRIHGESIPFADAALELRGALETAVEERLARGGPTTVWMSGGWDSSAVFAAGMARSEQGTPRAMAPVSISYPPGDPGREDELIQLAAERWSSGVRWIQIDDIPFIDQPARRAALRDDPFAHAYEQWLRHLARGSRAAGSRVALGGYGGDQLFTTSDVYLADLLKSGRWRDLREEWRARNRPGVRDFLRWAVTPVLPVPLIRALESLRGGRAIHGTLEQPLPSWIRPEFAAREGIFERQRRHAPPRVYGVAAHHEMFWYLTHAYFPRVSSAVAGIATDEGVEVRSPLFDRRIVALAAGRPWPERAWRRERKSLLRAAMRGLLPDSFLAPRARKTGITSGYFRRSMEAELPGLLELAQGTMLLADLGIVDPEALRRAGERYLRGHAENLGVPVLLTIQTELWLRGRPGAAAASRPHLS